MADRLATWAANGRVRVLVGHRRGRVVPPSRRANASDAARGQVDDYIRACACSRRSAASHASVGCRVSKRGIVRLRERHRGSEHEQESLQQPVVGKFGRQLAQCGRGRGRQERDAPVRHKESTALDSVHLMRAAVVQAEPFAAILAAPAAVGIVLTEPAIRARRRSRARPRSLSRSTSARASVVASLTCKAPASGRAPTPRSPLRRVHAAMPLRWKANTGASADLLVRATCRHRGRRRCQTIGGATRTSRSVARPAGALGRRASRRPRRFRP